MQEERRNGVRFVSGRQRLRDARKMLIMIPAAFDFRKNHAKVHRQCDDGELVGKMDDLPFQRYRLKLTEREEDVIDIMEVQILGHFKTIIEVPREGAKELTAKEGNFCSGSVELFSLCAQCLNKNWERRCIRRSVCGRTHT